MPDHILLTGASGTLGRAIREARLFPRLITPSHKELDITHPEQLTSFFAQNRVGAVIHCAAMARIRDCEDRAVEAVQANIVGTSNLVGAVLAYEKKHKQPVRFIHISSDGVYPGTDGHYAETGPVLPLNRYGWTKLGAECAAHALSNYCIVRTNFFDPHHIRFERSATDIFNSKVPVAELAQALACLVERAFVGVVNIGGERQSDFNRYRAFKPDLLPCTYADIAPTLPCAIARDSSLDTSLWKRLCREAEAVRKAS